MADHARNVEEELSVEGRVLKVIADILTPDPERLTDDAYLVQDLGADSLDFVEIEVALEEEFGFLLDPEDSDELARVIRIGDVAPIVRRKLVGRLKPAERR